jgi:hypothetical protein
MSRRAGGDWEDPGWPLREVLPGLIPVIGRFLVRRRRPSTALGALRVLYLSLVEATILLAVVLRFLDNPNVEHPATIRPSTGAAIVVVIGFCLIALSDSIRFGVGARKDAPFDESQVVGAYRAVFFVRWALSDAAAILAFVMFFLAGDHLWIYLIGMVIGLIGMLRIAPTKRAIDEWDGRHRGTVARPSLGRLLTEPESGEQCR